MSEHITTKRQIKAMNRHEFDDLLNKCLLSDIEIEIMKRIYLKDQSMALIADNIGYSESGIKYKHRKIIQKISKEFCVPSKSDNKM